MTKFACSCSSPIFHRQQRERFQIVVHIKLSRCFGKGNTPLSSMPQGGRSLQPLFSIFFKKDRQAGPAHTDSACPLSNTRRRRYGMKPFDLRPAHLNSIGLHTYMAPQDRTSKQIFIRRHFSSCQYLSSIPPDEGACRAAMPLAS